MLWSGALKSTIGAVYQVINPIRIAKPEAGCHGLAGQLARAAEVERKRHGWFPHASSLALNLGSFAYVVYHTDDYLLATSGALLGFAVGELTIYTSPNELRSGSFGAMEIRVLPQLDSESVGLHLGGVF